MTKPDVSIIIRCYNEEKHIGKLLHGITEQVCDSSYEIILVDSGSTDDTVAIAKQFPVRIVSIRPEDFSFGRALNLGCSHARGEYFVFVSAHVYPLYDDWLQHIIRPFENKRIAAVYGKQRGGPQTQYSEHQIFAHWFPDRTVPVQETPFCNNANCAIRADLWQQVPYDEQLTGLEDLAWAREVMELDYRVSYAADAVIAHIHEETPAQVKNRYMREAIALRQILPDEEMSFSDFVRLFTQNTFTDYVHAFIDGELVANAVDIPRFRLMQFWGAYKGFRQSGPVSEKLKRTFYYPRRLPFGSADRESEQAARKRIDYAPENYLRRVDNDAAE